MRSAYLHNKVAQLALVGGVPNCLDGIALDDWTSLRAHIDFLIAPEGTAEEQAKERQEAIDFLAVYEVKDGERALIEQTTALTDQAQLNLEMLEPEAEVEVCARTTSISTLTVWAE